MLLSIVGLVLKQRSNTLPNWIIQIGNLCMGIYILQQFILKAFYYYTGFSGLVNEYLFPWIGFFMALTLSVILSWMLRRVKIGRLLIG